MEIIKTESKKKERFAFLKLLVSDLVFESSASLSYYFLFSVFPFALFFSAVLATLNVNPESVIRVLGGLIPQRVLSLFVSYLGEISLGNSATLIFIGLILTIYSMSKAIQTMKRKVRRAYRSHPKTNAAAEWIVSLTFVVLMLVALYATLILIVTGNHILRFLQNFFGFSDAIFGLLQVVRSLIAGLFVFFILFGIYFLFPGVKLRVAEVLPGTASSMILWVLMSYLFSFYLNAVNGFSGFYGSLGTIIALLLWLYILNFIILIGAYLNASIYHKRIRKTHASNQSVLS